MVDFGSKLGGNTGGKHINPIELYNSLDRASDKGPLRPVQEKILTDWFNKFRSKNDVILKLHTGQGKTLIGLLILQSKLNEGFGPAIYICPNNYLIAQTKEQAKQFGIKVLVTNGELPHQFLDGKFILITSVQKLFNGLTKFGINNKSLKLGTLVVDDAHACIDSIKQSFIISIRSDESPYFEIFELFRNELEEQGAGTFADLKRKEYDALMTVPYWSWFDKYQEVSEILSKHSSEESIKFQWPIIKDKIKDYKCVISGDRLEISPYLNPIEVFGSYSKADHRVFMSATVNDDSSFVKGLAVGTEAIQNPLKLEKEKWSGEKMILIPELIDESLNRVDLINYFAKKKEGRKYGVVAITPGNNKSIIWEKCGAKIATTHSIYDEIKKLKSGKCEVTLVFSNRYDGIDLPDSACRLLILDSKPYSETLADRYEEFCRESSEIVAIKTAQKIEQGLGRGVRGEKDFCAIIITDSELVRTIKSKKSLNFFSNQTRKQIDIGFEISEFAEQEIDKGARPFDSLIDLLNQSLNRNEGWKEFYTQKMNELEDHHSEKKVLELLSIEKKAEEEYLDGEYAKAEKRIQELIDSELIKDRPEKGWYLQEAARYLYQHDILASNDKQKAAHKCNNFLLKPKKGMEVEKINLLGQKRIENIKNWIKEQGDAVEIQLKINEITSCLSFGVKSEKFEHALNELAFCLGFIGDRPDKFWKEGPDNLWTIRDNEYLLFECKNEVKVDRVEINKGETKQMNNSIAWFKNHYQGMKFKSLMIINAKVCGKGAVLEDDVELMREKHLKKLVKNVKSFFSKFNDVDLQNLSDKKIQEYLKNYNLDVENFKSEYSEKEKNFRLIG